MKRAILIGALVGAMLGILFSVATYAQTQGMELHLKTGYPGQSGQEIYVTLDTYSVHNAQLFFAAQGPRDICTLAVEVYTAAEMNSLLSIIGPIKAQLPSVQFKLEAEWSNSANIAYEFTVTVSSQAETQLLLDTIEQNISLFPGAQ